MSCIVTGSVAYDTIFEHHGLFSQAILADQIQQLNVAFLVPKMERHFGGCAGNIAYGLELLGMSPHIVASVGRDADHYLNYLKNLGLSTQYIQVVENEFTAQAMIMTDQAQNQITFFHPGAMACAHLNIIEDIQPKPSIAIVAPDATIAMKGHVDRLYNLGITTIFDPGQMLPTFGKNDLEDIVTKSQYLILNSYEAHLLSQTMRADLSDIAKNIIVIVTNAEYGATLYKDGDQELVTAMVAHQVIDPTGCGDAFRAGFVYGMVQHYPIEYATKIGHAMGAAKIASRGGQNYRIDILEIEGMIAQSFGGQPEQLSEQISSSIT